MHGEEGREGIQLLVECSAWGGGKGGDTAAGGVQCMGRREGGGDTADGGVHGEEGREGIQLMVECSAWGGGKGEGGGKQGLQPPICYIISVFLQPFQYF